MQLTAPVNILLVDDHPENLLALEAVLGKLGENLVRATSGEEALRCLLHQDFAVILLDVQMPGMDGFETATLIRSRPRSRQTPIIFLTAFSTSDQLMSKGYALGAVDYLHKPLDPVILASKVTVFVDLFRKTQAIQRQAAQLEAMNLELKQTEERFRSLSACSPVGIFVLDMDGRCIYSNPRYQAICGVSVTHSFGTSWINFVHPDDRERVFAAWADYVQEGQEYSMELRVLLPDQSERWVHVRSSPMLSDQQQLLGHTGTIEDITDRKQAEADRQQILHEQTARREAEAANRMKDEFLAVLSHELRTPLNSMLGWSRLLRTRKFDEVTTDRALETIERNAITQAQLIEDILDVSRIIRGKLRLNFHAVNLTEVVNAAIESVRPQAEAKGIEVIAHLKTNQQVSGDAVRLQQVVWNLLSNSIKFTPEGGRVEISLLDRLDSTPSSDSATGSGHVYIQVVDTGIGIKSDFLPYVFDRFRQADSTTTRLYNGLGLGLAIVHHLVELHGGRVEADSQGEDQGATFTVSLPLLVEPTGGEWQPALLQEAEPTGDTLHPGRVSAKEGVLVGVQVLLVDDEPDTRELLCLALKQFGATVETAASVEEALEVYDRLQPDVLVSDIGMPQADGYSLLQRLHLAQDGLAISAIALTAYSREEDRQKAISAGFQQYLTKPVEIADLVQAIAQLVHRQVHAVT